VTAESAAFRPVSRSPLSLLISQQIRDAIVSGQLSVGTELPTEKELAGRFQVSRPTIREALRILQAQGLLSGGDTVSTARPRISAEQTPVTASQALENAVRMGQIPLDDLVELRLLVEGAAAAHDVRVRAALADAQAALEVMRTPGIDIEAFHDADVRFHTCLAGASGNTAFTLVMTVLRDAIAGYLLSALQAVKDPVAVLARLTSEHAAILDAVTAGRREQATALIHAHIWGFYAAPG
jgi:GntR family transcriptional repressor for pyruvate dehydrogenase complex